MKIHTSGVERWLFNVGAVLGSLCLVLAAVTLVFGLKPLIFTSGSMAPAIPTGALAFAVPTAAGEVSPGDVVSVVSSDGVRITHRVVAADPAFGLVLKGDANAVADLQPYTGASVDRVLFSVPGLGYVASWLASPWLFGLGGLLCVYLIYVAFFRRGGAGDAGSDAGPEHPNSETEADGAKPGTRRRTWLGTGAIVTVTALAAGLGLSSPLATTQAAFFAEVQASSAVAAAVMQPPSNVTCGQGTNSQTIVFKWAAPATGAMAPTGYRISVQVNNKDGSPSTTNNTTVVTPGLGTNTFSLDTNNSAGILGALLGALTDLLFGYNYTATVKISATYPAGWSSAAVVYNKVHATYGGLLGAPKKLTCQLQ